MIAAAVIAAGAIGALLRYLVSRWSAGGAAAHRKQFPWAVLIVNVGGSAVGGVVLGLAVAGNLSPELRLVLLTGFCGGLTTFSTFSVETLQLVIDGRWRVAFVSVAANLVAGIGIAALAYTAAVGQA